MEIDNLPIFADSSPKSLPYKNPSWDTGSGWRLSSKGGEEQESFGAEIAGIREPKLSERGETFQAQHSTVLLAHFVRVPATSKGDTLFSPERYTDLFTCPSFKVCTHLSNAHVLTNIVD